MKKYIAEAIGTFTFISIIIMVGETGFNSLLVISLVALALTLVVHVFGKISGGHVNPAITIGHLVVKKISLVEAVGYLLSQLTGAAIALLIFHLLGHKAEAAAPFTRIEFMFELVASIVFSFGIAAIAFNKVDSVRAPAVAGLSLFFGLFLGNVYGKSLVFVNPAVAFGMSASSVSHLLAPIMGAIIGFLVFWLISESNFLDFFEEKMLNDKKDN